ncbi:response regulator transcription factor [Olivibacter domesticus]|uniref:DNA-binding response regulator, OmpR family, contains REC and winged-helix (WHTH) domain n=1 Tax=Olivibacter domesticus TaxID=407022 RepID=A0A1H7MYB1_OLID1|nr:response regulator transcription factor [Olivibacter domesticus]SEL15738.1 DNA-binding response regulator, OmpR family, contains REC and winged-helix (wHTH) domain [Olivibacter domesticus]
MKILIIEDERELVNSITEYLSGEQYLCELAASYNEGMDKMSQYSYDCIVLDLMLPDGNGLKILEELKRRGKEDGVIIVSAKDSLEDRLKGLTIGADDYLSKPFHLSELAARIYAVIRRRQLGSQNIIHQGEITIDVPSRTVAVNGHEVVLTRREFDLLVYFISNKNKVVSKNAIAEHLSGDFADMLDSYDFIYGHIKNLKKKLSEFGADNYLKTIYGAGYKWEV